MKAKTAKELGGHYCVCQVYSRSLFPRTVAYSSLEQANAVWKELDLPNMIVALLQSAGQVLRSAEVQSALATVDYGVAGSCPDALAGTLGKKGGERR